MGTHSDAKKAVLFATHLAEVFTPHQRYNELILERTNQQDERIDLKLMKQETH